MFDIRQMFYLVTTRGYPYYYTDQQFTIILNKEIAYDEYATITIMYKAFVVRLKDGRPVCICEYEDHPDGFEDVEYNVATEFEINQVDQFLEQFYKFLQEDVNE